MGATSAVTETAEEVVVVAAVAAVAVAATWAAGGARPVRLAEQVLDGEEAVGAEEAVRLHQQEVLGVLRRGPRRPDVIARAPAPEDVHAPRGRESAACR